MQLGDWPTEQKHTDKWQYRGPAPREAHPVPVDQDHLKVHSLTMKPLLTAGTPSPWVHRPPQSSSLAQAISVASGYHCPENFTTVTRDANRYPSQRPQQFLQPDHLCLVLSSPLSLSTECKACLPGDIEHPNKRHLQATQAQSTPERCLQAEPWVT